MAPASTSSDSSPSGSSRTWQHDHPWARIYTSIVANEKVGGTLWRIGTGSTQEVLHAHARRAFADARPAAGRAEVAVLDIPCGGGVVLRDLPADFDGRYVAADVSPAMLQRTRHEAERLDLAGIETTEADVQALRFADDTFDLAVAYTSLHCFPDPAGAVRELARVVRSGGRLAGSAYLNDAGLRHTAIQRSGRALGLLGPGGTRRDLRGWLAAAGCTDLRIRSESALTYFSATVR